MTKSHVATFTIPALIALASCVDAGAPATEPVATAPEVTQPALRVKEDIARGRRWELGWGTASAYDVATDKLVRRIGLDGATLSGARDACLPDMVLDRSGALVVSSNAQPVLWRISPSRFEVERYEIEPDGDHDKDFGFSDLAWAADERTLYAASTATGTAWRIDLATSKATRVAPSAPAYGACARMHTPGAS